MDSALPQDLQEFLSRQISSVTHLELLLLMRSTMPREWNAIEMARELRIDPAWAESAASHLCERGLLVCDRTGEPRYRYAPTDTELGALIDRLAETYADRRVSVISFLYSRPPSQLKILADAFRIRRPDPDG